MADLSDKPIPHGTWCMRCRFRYATRRIQSVTGRNQVACDECATKAATSWITVRKQARPA